MSLGGNQKPRPSWWAANQAGRNWFSNVKHKLTDRSTGDGASIPGARVGDRQTKN